MKQLVFFCLFIFSGIILKGQTLDELRSKKEKAREQIEYTNHLLNEARENEKYSLNKLKLINEQINLRSEIITGFNNEIDILDNLITENTEVIEAMDNDLNALKSEYAEMIRFAEKNRNSYDKILFLLSSKDFNQAYKRLLYLQQYAGYRRKQAVLISEMRDLINKKNQDLEKRKAQKQKLVEGKIEETNRLNQEKDEQGKSVDSLQQKLKDLIKALKEQQKTEEQLSHEIDRIIEEASKPKEKGGTGGFMMTPEQKMVSGRLEQNCGRLPWPVERGIITEHFGIHAHPILKTVQVKSNGIDISTTKGSKARAVFDGEVSRVFGISGGNMAVILRHGNYLTVYSNLKDVAVKAGDKVSTKQELGTIFTDESDGNKTILKFQIWKENQKLDPEEWLSR